MPRILVIDDEHAVRTVIELMLRRDGHQVELAERGQAGVDAVARGPFDAVFVDMLMPGMDGMSTIAAIRQIAPAMPIVAMSGMVAAHKHDSGTVASPDDADTVSGMQWLRKPFRPNDLRQAVENALGAGKPGEKALAS